ncbi:hypothetical protein Tco_0335549, partial [Tanacetum coccineum]
IPCLPECKIVGHILLDHPLSYALTATVDVPTVYLQQFWKTVSKVLDTKDTIIFKLDTQEIVYIVDMFHDTRVGYQGVVDKLFHDVVNRTNVDYAALLWWDFMNYVFQKKDVIQYPRFTKLIIADLMKKYPSILERLDDDYHSVKYDIPLVSVYSTGNVLFRGIRIPDAFLTNEICATDDYKEYETVFIDVEFTKKIAQSYHQKKKQSTTPIPPPSDDTERDEIIEATLLSLTLHKTMLATKAQENVAKVQEKLTVEEIEKMVEGKEDEESYASEFVVSMFNDDDDDSSTRIEPVSYKENPKVVDDDDVTKKKDDKKDEDEVKDDDVEKTNDVAEKKDNDDHTDHTLIGTHATCSMDTRNEQMQTPIPTPNRSPMNDLSSDKTFSKELMAPVSPTTTTTSKTKSKRGFTSNKMKILPGSIVGMCR